MGPPYLQMPEFALSLDIWEIHAAEPAPSLPKLNSNHPRSGKRPWQNRFLPSGGSALTRWAHPPPAYKCCPGHRDIHLILSIHNMLGITVFTALLAYGKLRLHDQLQSSGCELGQGWGQGPSALQGFGKGALGFSVGPITTDQLCQMSYLPAGQLCF